ncbi:Tn3 family transposase [Nocardia xishanensis]
MEDQLSAFGLVLNCRVLWNTFYTNRALEHLRAQGYPILDADGERLSAFIRAHIGIDGPTLFTCQTLGAPTGRCATPISSRTAETGLSTSRCCRTTAS